MIELNKIYNEDCLGGMKRIPDGFVDLTVTSPPYDNLRTYNGNIEQWSFEKFQAIAKELYRVTKQGGVVVWIVGDATINGSETGTSFKQALYFMECGFNLHDTMIWSKPSFTAVGALKTRYAQTFEYMFVFSKGKIKTFNALKDRKTTSRSKDKHGMIRQKDGSFRPMSNRGKQYGEFGIRYNVWDMPPVMSNTERTGHPAQFPEQLAKDHILSWSNEGDVVLDPFMGSGTTAVACINTNRNYIGFEIDPDYYEAAQKRLQAVMSQVSMFREVHQ
jgi:site-specific DNA-methyltransferase (adenine-specific)